MRRHATGHEHELREQCISQSCFDEIYAEEPLEDGEVDSKRSSVVPELRAEVSCRKGEATQGGARRGDAGDG